VICSEDIVDLSVICSEDIVDLSVIFYFRLSGWCPLYSWCEQNWLHGLQVSKITIQATWFAGE